MGPGWLQLQKNVSADLKYFFNCVLQVQYVWYSDGLKYLQSLAWRNTDLARISGFRGWFTAEIPIRKYVKSEIVLSENGKYLPMNVWRWYKEAISTQTVVQYINTRNLRSPARTPGPTGPRTTDPRPQTLTPDHPAPDHPTPDPRTGTAFGP